MLRRHESDVSGCNGFKGEIMVAPKMQPQGEADAREPRLARRSPFAPVTKLCPKCLTPLKELNRNMTGWIPMEYYCANCGYSGIVYVEKEQGPSAGKE